MEKTTDTKQSKIKVIYLLLLFLMCYATYEGIIYFSKTKSLKETNLSFVYDFNSNASFHTYKNNLFFATKDGMRFIDNKGKTIWDDIYTMSEPKIISEGEFVVVSEKRGKDVRVYNQSGLMFSVPLEYPLLNISMNNKGYICLIVEKNNIYDIIIYDDRGSIVNYWEHTTYNVIPLTADISNDCRILAASFLDINGSNIGTKIVYSYINKEESNKKLNGQVTGGVIDKDKFILKINFMENNNLIVVSDKDIICLTPKDDQKLSFKEKWNIPLKNKLSNVEIDKDKNIIVAFGEGNLNEEAEEVGLVKVIDLKGSTIAKYNTTGEVTYLSTNFNSIIIGQNRNFLALSFKGDILWEYSGLQDVKEMLFFENKNGVVFVGDVNASVMKLKK